MRKQSKPRQFLALIATECPKTDLLIFFQVFTEHLENPEYPSLSTAEENAAEIQEQAGASHSNQLIVCDELTIIKFYD